MITYIYWAIIIGIAISALIIIGGKLQEWKSALVAAVVIIAVGYGAYYFHFQQIFVKRYGGVMAITVPEGELHLAATWKDDNLWIENYNPQTNTCHFFWRCTVLTAINCFNNAFIYLTRIARFSDIRSVSF